MRKVREVGVTASLRGPPKYFGDALRFAETSGWFVLDRRNRCHAEGYARLVRAVAARVSPDWQGSEPWNFTTQRTVASRSGEVHRTLLETTVQRQSVPADHDVPCTPPSFERLS